MSTPAFRVYDCTINDLCNPCGLDSTPLFSFKLDSALRGDEAAARRIRVTAHRTGELLWDSGIVFSAQQLYIPYEGAPLHPLTRYDYTVTVTARSGSTAESGGSFVTGKLGSRWSGKWITDITVRREPDTHGAQYLRKTFAVKENVDSAYLAICGLGYFESYLNGRKTGDDVLSPAFTRYDAEAQYLVYDVTGQLHPGLNALGVILGNGWYNCFTEDAWNVREATWRHLPKLLCELHVTYADGTSELIRSDLTWKAAKGPIIFNSIRNGEYYDARLELGAWDTAGYDDSAWGSVKLMKSPGGLLKAMEMEPIRVRAVHPAIKMWKSRDGHIFDIGQNQAGVGQFTLHGKAGTEYRFRYAEELTPDGEINQLPVCVFTRSGEFQTDKYVKKSDAPETWHARFAYHGFRYIEITGMDAPALSDVCALTLCTDVKDAGWFDSSSDTLCGTQHMSRWSTISNMHSIPTDDPHREKNGWIGDVSMSAEQMMLNFGSAAFLSKWCGDLRTAQRPAGQIPCVVPSTGWGYYGLMGPDWSSALINVPWYIYLYTGNRNVLAQNYDTICRNFEFMETMTTDLTLDYGTGDWCAPFDGPGIGVNMGSYKCPTVVSDTGFFYYAAVMLAKMARLLEKPEDEAYYTDMAAQIRAVFRSRFFDPVSCTVKGDCQTATAVMLYFGLYEPEERAPLLHRLLKQIDEKDGHLDFGVLGCKMVMQTLGQMGYADVGVSMMEQKTYPSLRNWLDLGATTLWECWNGGGDRNGSLNQHMFSDFAAFMHKYIGGIAPDEAHPGFRHIIFRPGVDSGVASASSRHASMYGSVACAWSMTNGALTLDLQIPTGCTGTLYLPQKMLETLNENGRPLCGDGASCVELTSGNYHLTAQK